MAWPPTDRNPWGMLGPDPGRSIPIWVALLLRMGVGLSLLNTGLAGYFRAQGGGNPWGQAFSLAGLDPFLSALPYLSIGLGLALVLGFLTTASAIAAGFSSLLSPMFSIVQIVGAGATNGVNMGGRWANDPFFGLMATMSLPTLLTYAALIWLSPLEYHPYSVDALIFGRNEIEEAEPAPPLASEPLAAGEAGSTIHLGE